MKYSRVYVDAIGYELAPVVVSTAELEGRLETVYRQLHIPVGQLEAMTGIVERRWWEENFPVSQGAVLAARKALATSDVKPGDVDALIYAGVCRENFEPATACKVAAGLGVSPSATVYDISNACLGVLNGIIDLANRVELGQIRAGLVVSCETAREINEVMIDQMLRQRSIEVFTSGLATLTGGSGAVAVLVTDGSFAAARHRRLAGGVTQTAPQHHNLCRWGLQSVLPAAVAMGQKLTAAGAQMLPANLTNMLPAAVQHLINSDTANFLRSGLLTGVRNIVVPFMFTDASNVLKHGVELGVKTWNAFTNKIGWGRDHVDRFICHQVGSKHHETILKTLGIPAHKDFSTYPYLGNIGTVSLPLTAAMAEEQEFIRPDERVSFLGIGSGLNCLMLGLEWVSRGR